MHIIHTLWQPVYFSGQPVVFLSCSSCSSFATLSFWPFLPIDPRYKVKPSDGHGSRMISIRHRPGTWPAKRNECNLYHNGYMNLEIPWERGQSGPVQKCSCGPLDFLDCLSLCFVYGNELTRKSNHFLATSLSIRAPWSSHYVYLLRLSLFTPLFQQSSQFVQLVVQELWSNSRSVVKVCMFEYVYAYHGHVSYINIQLHMHV